MIERWFLIRELVRMNRHMHCWDQLDSICQQDWWVNMSIRTDVFDIKQLINWWIRHSYDMLTGLFDSIYY
jgi:hypothetical protein